MELGSILKFLENKTLLVTGATGFLSKIMVEKILRIQPNVKKIYLLVRAADQNTANQRLRVEIIGKDLFRVMKQKMGGSFECFIEEKVRMVAGDISYHDLDIKDDQLKDEMFTDLDVIVNSAATTNFFERYDVSLNVNTFGAKHVLEFAKKCINLKVLIHVSTAYVSGRRGGLISETAYCVGGTLNGTPELDIEEEKRLVDRKLNELQAEEASPVVVKSIMKDLGLERMRGFHIFLHILHGFITCVPHFPWNQLWSKAKKYGWPNVYAFTKALGEMMLIEYKECLPVVIIRPTIVTSTYKEPFPGWVEGIRTIDGFSVRYGKGRLSFVVADPESVIDMIPADMVVNVTLVAAAAHASQTGEAAIYHVGSSARNPVKIGTFRDAAYTYFTKHPWINKKGKPVKVSPCKIINSIASFRRYVYTHYELPLKGLRLANVVLCQWFASEYMEMKRKMDIGLRFSGIYEPYLFFKGIFDDRNTEELRVATMESAVETEHFYIDPKDINWEDYFLRVHIPGLVKYEFKQNVEA